MKASKLLNEIRENLKGLSIDYLKNKVTDDRYKDPLPNHWPNIIPEFMMKSMKKSLKMISK